MSGIPVRGRPKTGGHNRYYCSHGLCTNNTKDIKENVKLLPFPKPCSTFISTLVDTSKGVHNINQCEQCSKCARWIHLCRRGDDRLQSLVDIKNSTYICTEHFHNGFGPTATHPDPLPATQHLKQGKRTRSEPKDRSKIPIAPPRKRRKTSGEGLVLFKRGTEMDVTSVTDNDEIDGDQHSNNLLATPSPIFDHGYAYVKPTPSDDFSTNSRPTLFELACLFLKNNLTVTFRNDLVEVRSLQEHVVEKTCTIDSELKISILVYNRVITSDHPIWKKYPKKWVAGFNYIVFLKDVFENWFVCESCTDSNLLSKFKDCANHKRRTFKYDPVSNSLRSVYCCLLDQNHICSHCLRMAKKLQTEKIRQGTSKVKKRRIYLLSQSDAQKKLRQTHYKLILEKRKTTRLQKRMKATIHNGVKMTSQDNADFLHILQKDRSTSSDLAKLFFEEQVKAAKVKSKYGHRWHPLIIKWCLYLKAKSCSTYTALRKVITLPSEKRLFQLQSLTHVKPGFHDEVLATIEREFQDAGSESHRRYCALIYDEVKIQEDLVYKGSTGEIVGFVQLSDVDQLLQDISDEVKGLRKTEETLASHVLQLMVRGISSNVETTYAYFATKTLKAYNLFTIIWEAVERLEGKNIRVLALVSDGAAANRALYKMSSGGKEANWYTQNPYAPERSIYFVCDIPHLQKTARNCVSNSGSHKKSRLLRKNNHTIEWYHFIRAYKEDLSSSFRILHHITNDHLYLTPTSIMKVKLAVQVLSQRMATAMKKLCGDEVSETVKFIELFNKFFDVMNTRHLKEGMLKRNPNLNAYTCPDDERLVWLNDTFLGYLDEWKREVEMVPGNFSARDKKKMMLSQETMDGLHITAKKHSSPSQLEYLLYSVYYTVPNNNRNKVRSVTAMIKFMLSEGAPFILTNKFNQDPLEMEFSKQRGASGANTNPNVLRYGDNVGKLKCLKEYAYVGRGNISQR